MLINVTNKFLNKLDAYPLSFTTKESLSNSPVYVLSFQSLKPNIDFKDLLGQPVLVEIELADGIKRRPFYVYVTTARDNGQNGEHFVYELELSTWLWFLKQNRNSKIFQELNVIDIVEDIFSRYKFSNYKLKIKNSYPKKEYCVQFNESDFNYVNRLLEFEGIWYYFEHEKNKHTLVITDEQKFDDLPPAYRNLDFIPDGEENRAIREGIQKINRQNKVSPKKIVLRDFDYLEPKKNLHVNVDANEDVQGIPLEWYDYAENYTDSSRGEHLASLRLEEMASATNSLRGESNAIGLEIGKAFKLSLHPDKSKNRKFKLLECNYIFIQDGPDSANSLGKNVNCKFVALNDDEPYRPVRKTPKPKVSGIQSATVVGPVKSEVHTDKHGRIRVHFHWDRYKTTEEDSSCWIRVVQAWAGKGWGVLAMPRVGQEVLITYVDGDIDRPLSMGIVYNGDNPPPYELPKDINYSGLVSRSLRFGVPKNANMLTFDDKRNRERIMQHSERDFQGITERNDVKYVGQDLYEVVKRVVVNWYKAHISYKDFVLSVTGLNVSFTGTNISNTGFALSSTGASVSFTGSNTSFTGVATSFTGASTSFTGFSNSFTGRAMSHTGYSTSMTGQAESFTSKSSSVTGESESYTGSSQSTTGSSMSVVGSSISVTGSSISTTGSSVSTTGSSISTTGCSISTTGSSISTTGSAISTTGSSISTTGSAISTTGSSISTTGSSISTQGSSISIIGMSMSIIGVQITHVGISIKA